MAPSGVKPCSIRFPHGGLRAGSVSRALSLLRGENTMPTYRVYLIDENDRVASYRPVEAKTDTDAMTAAHQFINGCDIEVWHLDRKVGRLGRPRK
jgi:hypothetical protein